MHLDAAIGVVAHPAGYAYDVRLALDEPAEANPCTRPRTTNRRASIAFSVEVML